MYVTANFYYIFAGLVPYANWTIVLEQLTLHDAKRAKAIYAGHKTLNASERRGYYGAGCMKDVWNEAIYTI